MYKRRGTNAFHSHTLSVLGVDVSRLLISVFLLQLYTTKIVLAMTYAVVNVPKTKEDAMAECDKKNMFLAVPQDQDSNEDLRSVMTRNNLSKVWLGVHESLYPWKWASDGSVVENQGCYKELAYLGPGAGELSEYLQVDKQLDFTQFKEYCKENCKARNYKYTALRLTGDIVSNKRSKECGCGNSFGEVGPSNLPECPKECFLDQDVICGNSYHNLVFANKGSASLVFDDSGADSYATCVAMRNFYKPTYGLSYYSSKMTPCWTYRKFLCDVPKGDRVCEYSYPIDRCIIAVYEHKSWFDARQACVLLGGDLAKVGSHGEAEEIRVAFGSSWQADDPEGFWIGLTRSTWTTPDSSPIAYYNWSVGFPSSGSRRCVVMDENGEWSDEECSSYHPFICSPKPVCQPGVICNSKPGNEKAIDSKNIAIIVIVVLVFLVIVAVIFAVIHHCCLKCKMCVNSEPERTVTKHQRVITIRKATKGFQGQDRSEGEPREEPRYSPGSDSGSLTPSVYTMSQNDSLPIQIQGMSLSYTEAATLERGHMSTGTAKDEGRIRYIVKESTVVVEEPIHTRQRGVKQQSSGDQRSVAKAPATPPPPVRPIYTADTPPPVRPIYTADTDEV